MKIINIYKGKEKIISIYANSLEEVKKEPKNYYQEYTEDMYITDQEFSNPTIDSSGELREMTREEFVLKGQEISLNDGEIIKNKKIITIKKPSDYHKWDGTEWTINLDEVKEQKRNFFKNMLTEKDNANLEYEGHIYQMRESDRPHFTKIKMSLDILESIEDIERILILLEELDADMVSRIRENAKRTEISKDSLIQMLEHYETEWRLIDNTMLKIPYWKVKEILLLANFRTGRLNAEYNEINKKLLNAETIEEIEAIKWEE